MENLFPYQRLADAVLVAHFAIVVFVVGGLVLIIAGNVLGWRWANNRWFRGAHLVAICVVVVQAWLGKICPLTVWESWLREHAGEATYKASFIEHWVQRMLYFEAPSWLFALVYTIFGLLVVMAWWYFPPRRSHGQREGR